MVRDWKDLIQLTGDQSFVVERVHIPDTDISIEGAFELPPLAKLSTDDQLFVAMFVQTHGSIKEMERLFGISYPTVKARLSKIASRLGGAIVETTTESAGKSKTAILEKIEKGEMKVEEALEFLK
ncbi:MAG: DUF2089 domain-containing protein [Bdellovibrio sp.]